jgi:hypothetical protein
MQFFSGRHRDDMMLHPSNLVEQAKRIKLLRDFLEALLCALSNGIAGEQARACRLWRMVVLSDSRSDAGLACQVE